METFAGRGVVFVCHVHRHTNAHLLFWVELFGVGAGLQREVNKYKFLEVKDSVLVPSLCPAPDAMCNSE